MTHTQGEILWTALVAFTTSASITAGKFVHANALDDSTMFLLGVCFNALFLSTIGSLLAILLGAEAIKPPRRMWILFTASALIGAVAVVILPKIPMLHWTGEIPAQATALVMGFALRWVIPIVIDVAPAWIRKRLGLPAINGDV
jgi:hypothetical protein